MNKKDIFKIKDWTTDDIRIEACLTWDETKCVRVNVENFNFGYAEDSAIGALWDKYADEIIRYIQAHP